MASLEEIRAKVLKRVNPSESERKKVLDLAQKLTENVEKEAKSRGVEADVRVEGSVAKNTWLKDSPEIDVFIRVPASTPKEEFGTTLLDVAKKATEGYKQIERFAEHPYLEAIMDGVYVNIVPCYNVKSGEWISATDRTPFHTDYIKPHLDEKMGEEVRLLKRFMKGISVYGAEIKTGGFSGYLCELLVLNYGSFDETLRSAANWKEKTVIDYKRHYKTLEDAQTNFEEPLVMVDPVDKTRNVAAAVTQERLNEFVAASREFLKTPTIDFFYPQQTRALNTTEMANTISARGSAIVFIKFEGAKAVPDVLWGQLYKSQRALQKIIKKHDFTVLRDSVWSNEKDLNMFVFELENRFLPSMKHHLGPPIKNRLGCEKFLQKHVNSDLTVSGPRIEDERWVVDVKRGYRDVVKLLNEKLKDGGKRYGVAELVSKAIAKSGEVLVNDEILKTCTAQPDFAKFLTEYLQGKPKWLQIKKKPQTI